MKINNTVHPINRVFWRGHTIFGMLLLSSLAITHSVSADTLEIPTDIGASNEVNISKPSRGMTMDDVTTTYGEPSEIIAPVGDPPITRWVYPNFIVHFERQYVIYAVVKKKQR